MSKLIWVWTLVLLTLNMASERPLIDIEAHHNYNGKEKALRETATTPCVAKSAEQYILRPQKPQKTYEVASLEMLASQEHLQEVGASVSKKKQLYIKYMTYRIKIPYNN